MRNFMRILTIVGAVFLLASTAHSTVMQFAETGDGSYSTTINYTNPDGSWSGWIGAFNVTYSDRENEEFLAFCVEPNEFYSKEAEVEIQAVDTISGGLEAAWLMDTYGDGDNMAALQIAIWEVVWEEAGTVYGLGSDSFTAEGADVAKAQEYLDSIDPDLISSMSSYLLSNYTVMANGEGQDFITNRPAESTPEPATMFLFGSGLAGLAALRRKYGKKQAS